jgi:hypothetical protein
VQHTGTLTSVSLYLYTPGTAGDFVIQILGVDGTGTPVNGVLASQIVDDAAVPVGGFVTVHPAPVLNVTAGQRFGLTTSRPGSDTSGVQTVQMDPCAGGELFIAGAAPNLFGAEGSDHEMPYSAFVTLTPPPPATSSPTTSSPAAVKKCKRKKKKHRRAATTRKRCKKRKKK